MRMERHVDWVELEVGRIGLKERRSELPEMPRQVVVWVRVSLAYVCVHHVP